VKKPTTVHYIPSTNTLQDREYPWLRKLEDGWVLVAHAWNLGRLRSGGSRFEASLGK
jgi:hypothetical protein